MKSTPLFESSTAKELGSFSPKELAQLGVALERLKTDAQRFAERAKANERRLTERLARFGMRHPDEIDRRLALLTAVRVGHALLPTMPERGPSAELAQRVRDARMGIGLTQAEFAERLGVAVNTVARWERAEMGIRPASLKLIMQIAAQKRPK